MANLKEIRNRIVSVSSTMQITSAMKMVSAAKLKKAQDAITAMRPYADKLSELLQNFSGSIDGETGSKYTDKRDVKNVLIVAITSNRGLCGAFNTNIIKHCLSLQKDHYMDKQVDFMSIGKKAHDLIGKRHNVISDHSEIYDGLNYILKGPMIKLK